MSPAQTRTSRPRAAGSAPGFAERWSTAAHPAARLRNAEASGSGACATARRIEDSPEEGRAPFALRVAAGRLPERRAATVSWDRDQRRRVDVADHDDVRSQGGSLDLMATLVRDPQPVEFERLLERRRRLGQDLLDEVWDGVYHMNPAPAGRHADIAQQLAELLRSPAREAGLVPMLSISTSARPTTIGCQTADCIANARTASITRPSRWRSRSSRPRTKPGTSSASTRAAGWTAADRRPAGAARALARTRRDAGTGGLR